ncbi:FecCD family ABC transporter permease [Bacillus fonticola]|uniref:FecCD family ABC transporter permease n=1 Tax=Bacillus fonticola TaxID=2728853 RepID=UPI0014740DAE|nr:iron ABC transporter permease [Bacillus fonticola]
MEQDLQSEQTQKKKVPKNRVIVASVVLLVGTVALLFSLAASISYGAADIDLKTVWEAVFFFDASLTEHNIIQELRLPRALTAALVGAFLAVSGAIMQGMTKNPLASPSIMGVMDGAAFSLALVFAFYPAASFVQMMGFSFVGAAFGAMLVFGVAMMAKGGMSPVKLALAGTAVGALLSSFSSGISIYFQTAQDLSFWFAGGVSGAQWTGVGWITPVAVIGILGAIAISRSITLLSLGEEVATGLGQNNTWVKVWGVLLVLLMTGAAVSVAGSVGFVGLVVPHIARFLVGVDYRTIIPCSAILGALLLVLADIGSRMVNPPFETPIGAITAMIGVPFFLYLARREGGSRV